MAMVMWVLGAPGLQHWASPLRKLLPGVQVDQSCWRHWDWQLGGVVLEQTVH